jgi:hypothetical protein
MDELLGSTSVLEHLSLRFCPQAIINRRGDFRRHFGRDSAIRCAGIQKVRKLLDPIPLEHVEIPWSDILLQCPRFHEVVRSEDLPDPVVDDPSCSLIERRSEMLPTAALRVALRLSHVSGGAILSAIEAVNVAHASPRHLNASILT